MSSVLARRPAMEVLRQPRRQRVAADGRQGIAGGVLGARSGLAQLRLFLELSPDERFRSPPITLSPDWSSTASRCRCSSTSIAMATWKRSAGTTPHGVQRLSFKLGHFMNDVGATGEAAVAGLRFE